MVTKIKNWWNKEKADIVPFLKSCGCIYACTVITMVLLHFAGCNAAKPPSASVTPQPIAGISMIVLADGQSAVLLEDVIAKARVPFQGDALYEGEVRFQRGSMVVKPRVE